MIKKSDLKYFKITSKFYNYFDLEGYVRDINLQVGYHFQSSPEKEMVNAYELIHPIEMFIKWKSINWVPIRRKIIDILYEHEHLADMLVAQAKKFIEDADDESRYIFYLNIEFDGMRHYEINMSTLHTLNDTTTFKQKVKEDEKLLPNIIAYLANSYKSNYYNSISEEVGEDYYARFRDFSANCHLKDLNRQRAFQLLCLLPECAKDLRKLVAYEIDLDDKFNNFSFEERNFILKCRNIE